MKDKRILIAAVADNGVIGNEGKVPWHIGEDLQRFKKLTVNHAILMGRNTYESIGKPLPGRLNVVLSRSNHIPNSRELVVSNSLEEAIKICKEYREDGVFYVIGGSDVYRQTIEDANKLEITHVHQYPNGDSFFPDIDMADWRKAASQRRHGYEFATYERR